MGKPIEACHMAVGTRIRMVREALGLSQEDIGTRCGLSRTSITNIEAGRQRMLLDDIEKLAAAVGTTPKHLLKGVWW